MITAQPSNTSVSLLGTASFSVTAASGTTMTYQWLFNGANIAGAMTSSYTISNVQLTNQGNYSVDVINGGGTVVSSSATLTVTNVAPVITTTPQSQAAKNNASVTFSVVASGSAPKAYQWEFKGTNIAGATNSTRSLNKVQAANAGNYTVIVANPAGTNSAVAVLTVNAAPYILSQPPERGRSAWPERHPLRFGNESGKHHLSMVL